MDSKSIHWISRVRSVESRPSRGRNLTYTEKTIAVRNRLTFAGSAEPSTHSPEEWSWQQESNSLPSDFVLATRERVTQDDRQLEFLEPIAQLSFQYGLLRIVIKANVFKSPLFEHK